MSTRKPRAFPNATAFRAWLSKHHQRTAELLVRCFKVHARERGITYSEALDEALCFGWIDGVRRGLDADSFTVRFTPRRPKSVWSNVNVRHAQRLEAEGRMAPAGLAAFRARVASRWGVYSFESRPLALDRPLERKLRAHRAAWKFHQSRPPGYRRTAA